MEVLHLDLDSMSSSHKSRQHYQENSESFIDFEEISSFEGSMDSGKIKSIKMSPHCSEDLSKPCTPARREETYIERIKDIGTNLKYNLELLSQTLWIKDNIDTTKAYLLGKEFELSIDSQESNHQYKLMKRMFSDIIWFTYRKNFPKLNHRELPLDESSYVSDTGWGCMIRACQMIFAESLRKSIKDDRVEEIVKDTIQMSQKKTKQLNRLSMRREESIKNERCATKVISWFLDCEVDPTISPYSIQNICSYLYQKLSLKPGTWFKPSSVLLAIQAMHDNYKQHTSANLEIEIFHEGTIYISQILKKVINVNTNKSSANFDLEKAFEVIEEEDDLSLDFDDENVKGSDDTIKTDSRNVSAVGNGDAETAEENSDLEKLLSMKWHSSLVLFIMTKIGLDKPNPEYIPFIKELLAYPESIGMIGGKPGLACYNVGYKEENLMCLDPHFVQESVESKEKLKEKLDSYFCKSIKFTSFTDIDTSVGFGFFIKNEEEFGRFLERFKSSCQKKESFFGVELHPPQDDIVEIENIEEEGDFEMISLK